MAIPGVPIFYTLPQGGQPLSLFDTAFSEVQAYILSQISASSPFLGTFTTAARPIAGVSVGDYYLDSTLGSVSGHSVPVWLTQLTPTLIWCNSAGVQI